MTEVRVRRAPDGSIAEFAVSGHSGYADRGEDIVCAAISALTQTALMGLEHVARHPYEGKIRDGFLSCRIKAGGTPDSFARAQAILETMVLGLKDIASGYPDYLRVTEGG
jgi:uncharacterized protein YsxB (DUF464 family)